MAPLTRYRAPNHVPVERHAIYYGQRSTKGGLIITEATFISEEAGGYLHVPGIWSREQVEGWKKTTGEVHAKGGIIYLQLWAIGRANSGKNDVKRVVSASNIPQPNGTIPEPMTSEDIQRYIAAYRQAALNAVKAGFDGVEIHNANGCAIVYYSESVRMDDTGSLFRYLLNQFLESSSNKRQDEYGGSIENRSRFSKAVLTAVTSAIGEERVGIRLSPWSPFQGMGQEADPYETYGYLLQHIRCTYPRLSYVHIVEDTGAWLGKEVLKPRSNDPFRRIFKTCLREDGRHGAVFDENHEPCPTVFLSCGDYRAQTATDLVEEKGDVVAIGRSFISNPDIVERIRRGLAWTPYNRETFYGPLSDEGYVDYAPYGQRGHGEIAAEKKALAQAQKANI